jgi:molybdenum-dependent DNA-binding transcriptional regulator ModE
VPPSWPRVIQILKTKCGVSLQAEYKTAGGREIRLGATPHGLRHECGQCRSVDARNPAQPQATTPLLSFYSNFSALTIVAGLSMSGLRDFEGLVMFAKVAEERSFAAAAKAMGISVATVSRTVTRLDERLGGRLFNGTSRRLALTDYGRTLAERASKICTEAEEAEDLARETSRRLRGLVKLAAPLSFGTRRVAPLLPEFFRQCPDIAIDLHLTDAHADLIADGFDAALRVAVTEDSSLVAPF